MGSQEEVIVLLLLSNSSGGQGEKHVTLGHFSTVFFLAANHLELIFMFLRKSLQFQDWHQLRVALTTEAEKPGRQRYAWETSALVLSASGWVREACPPPLASCAQPMYPLTQALTQRENSWLLGRERFMIYCSEKRKKVVHKCKWK